MLWIDVGNMLAAVMDVIKSPRKGARDVGSALYQVMFEKLTEPAWMRFGMMLNEEGLALVMSPIRKCSNSCRKTPGTIISLNDALPPFILAIYDQAAVTMAMYRKQPSHSGRFPGII